MRVIGLVVGACALSLVGFLIGHQVGYARALAQSEHQSTARPPLSSAEMASWMSTPRAVPGADIVHPGETGEEFKAWWNDTSLPSEFFVKVLEDKKRSFAARNEAMNLLRVRSKNLRQDFAVPALAVMHDASEDQQMRAYAAQHLGLYLQVIPRPDDDVRDALVRTVIDRSAPKPLRREAIWAVLHEPTGSFEGLIKQEVEYGLAHQEAGIADLCIRIVEERNWASLAEALQSYAQSPNDDLRQAAQRTLAKFATASSR